GTSRRGRPRNPRRSIRTLPSRSPVNGHGLDGDQRALEVGRGRPIRSGVWLSKSKARRGSGTVEEAYPWRDRHSWLMPQCPVVTAALPTSNSLHDALGRPLRSLRLSVTDRCNLRCAYCMPEPEYVWLPKKELLTFEELDRITGIFCSLGVDKVRLTGGEPLLRSEITTLVRRLAGRNEVRDLAMTTNGVPLSERAHELREAGLRR